MANCKPPKCASCFFGKQQWRQDKASIQKPVIDKEMSLQRNDLFPSQQVSVDHFVSRVDGRTYESRGNPLPESMFGGGCIFVDHATGHISVQYQVSFSMSDTIKAVLKYQ